MLINNGNCQTIARLDISKASANQVIRVIIVILHPKENNRKLSTTFGLFNHKKSKNLLKNVLIRAKEWKITENG